MCDSLKKPTQNGVCQIVCVWGAVPSPNICFHFGCWYSHCAVLPLFFQPWGMLSLTKGEVESAIIIIMPEFLPHLWFVCKSCFWVSTLSVTFLGCERRRKIRLQWALTFSFHFSFFNLQNWCFLFFVCCFFSHVKLAGCYVT